MLFLLHGQVMFCRRVIQGHFIIKNGMRLLVLSGELISSEHMLSAVLYSLSLIDSADVAILTLDDQVRLLGQC